MPELYLIAPEIFLGSIETSGNLSLVATTLTAESDTGIGTGSITIGDGSSVILGGSIAPDPVIGTITLTSGDILLSDIVITVTPVPVPPALLLFASGFMVLFSRIKKA